MRNFVFGAIFGALVTVWGLGALPAPMASFLNNQICNLGEKAGIDLDLCGNERAPERSENDTSVSDSDGGNAGGGKTADSLRRSGVFEKGHLIEVYTCPVMDITNQPAIDETGRLTRFKPMVTHNGVRLAAAPVSKGCLSSGYGQRGGKLHRGVDFHADPNMSMVYAAAEGTIVEAEYRDDYGNMVVIDHGKGTYTRYAHLAKLASGIKVGKVVTGTTKLGVMGQTASYRIPVHLHYEILTGDFNTRAKSFGLTPQDPLG